MRRVFMLTVALVLLTAMVTVHPLPAALALDTSPLATKHCSSTSQGTAKHKKRVKVCISNAVVVNGGSDIFASGHADLPSMPGGSGVFPPELKFKAGPGRTLTFPAITGQVSYFYYGSPAGPGGAPGKDTDITGLDGISGIINHSAAMFLVGVFLTNREPADPAPPSVDFTNSGTITRLTPRLRQVFYIGDGVNRRITVPRKATRLYLGFADGANFQGVPGFYDDCRGALSVTMNLTG